MNFLQVDQKLKNFQSLMVIYDCIIFQTKFELFQPYQYCNITCQETTVVFLFTSEFIMYII